jgi:hypothetical protein
MAFLSQSAPVLIRDKIDFWKYDQKYSSRKVLGVWILNEFCITWNLPLYERRGFVRHITRWHSMSSGNTNLLHTGHLIPEKKRDKVYYFINAA